ncbi:uncharacterized protein LOC135112356 isoform X1 [Scylla paramamosain]|uniref:uncharacterized protein LOC135112356 isoform X1 n=1 Tax=Scylla paramamosain TaxID=85552 RepID=UPI003083428D
MQTAWTGVAQVKAGANPPDRKGSGVMEAVTGRRAARRSQSLMPEGASEVRRAGYSLTLRQGGFRSLVLGKGLDLAAQHDLAAAFGQDFPKSPSTLPRRSKAKVSLHKHLAVTTSDPTGASSRQCASCGGHPDQCLSALGLFEACDPHHHHPSYRSATTPKRTHSLLRRSRPPTHAPRRPSRSLTSRHKPKSILEEGGEGGEEASTPDSEVQTPDSETCTPGSAAGTPVSGSPTPDSSIHTPEDNIGQEKRIKEGKTIPRALRLLEMRSATLGKEEDEREARARRGEAAQARGGGAIEGKADPGLLSTIRRLSI